MTSEPYTFGSDRLLASNWRSISTSNEEMADVVVAILTPAVPRSLPDHWQGDYTRERSANWLDELDKEAAVLLVTERSSKQPVGLLILHESADENSGRIVRVGYMLAESAWGKGYATELLRALVRWCKTEDVSSIMGGVAPDNVASQRVMEKAGFVVSPNRQDGDDVLYVQNLE